MTQFTEVKSDMKGFTKLFSGVKGGENHSFYVREENRDLVKLIVDA